MADKELDKAYTESRKVYSLFKLNESIRLAIEEKTAGSRYWIRAEIAQIRIVASGHCYLELVDNRNGRTRAKSKAVIWADDLLNIHRELGKDADAVLTTGSEIQCSVQVSFHSLHGFSLHLKELDISFNLGQLEKKKLDTLRTLQKEGLLQRNAEKELAIVPQQIALIGAPETSGFADFAKQLLGNDEGYRFRLEVFSGPVQGEGVAENLSSRIIQAGKGKFDIAVLVRGGGSRMDLEVFNDIRLARAIAGLPFPLITGIGHETDLTVADSAAYSSCKTPTAAADFILERFRDFDQKVWQTTERIRMHAVRNLKITVGEFDRMTERFGLLSRGYTRLQRGTLHTLAGRLVRSVESDLSERHRNLETARTTVRQSVQHLITREKPVELSGFSGQLKLLSAHILQREKQEMAMINSRVLLQHPDNVLKRGYGIVRKNGKAVTSVDDLKSGEEINIQLIDRDITTSVISISQRKQK